MNTERLNDIKGIELHLNCTGNGCNACKDTGTNYRVSGKDWIQIRDELVSELDRLGIELNTITNFKPIPDSINKLPEKLRDYIHSLESSFGNTAHIV